MLKTCWKIYANNQKMQDNTESIVVPDEKQPGIRSRGYGHQFGVDTGVNEKG